MIKIYYLPIDRVDNTDTVRGVEYIHNAILQCTEKSDVRKLIRDTTPAEDLALSALAIKVGTPTKTDIANYQSLPAPSPPARDLAAEIDGIKASILEIKTSLVVSR